MMKREFSADQVVRSPTDGYTLLMGAAQIMSELDTFEELTKQIELTVE